MEDSTNTVQSQHDAEIDDIDEESTADFETEFNPHESCYICSKQLTAKCKNIGNNSIDVLVKASKQRRDKLYKVMEKYLEERGSFKIHNSCYSNYISSSRIAIEK